ncbi:hypothetical protein RHMOL_Rhmol13G0219700 [Rhododendron molle]|uniref:Uncharacterized protein n=1 Tax=Rhododendron molle TaxID=49168 RepID=A0ACC0LAY0_RHOML|nr:hypothetical protein RHMOL_Rhmol13G0219700 [Rhododendron molle]
MRLVPVALSPAASSGARRGHVKKAFDVHQLVPDVAVLLHDHCQLVALFFKVTDVAVNLTGRPRVQSRLVGSNGGGGDREVLLAGGVGVLGAKSKGSERPDASGCIPSSCTITISEQRLWK